MTNPRPSPPPAGPEPDRDARAHRLSVLAKSRRAELERELATLGAPADHAWIRRPEVGAVMVRGRAGGTGARFNLGEMTVTRCVLRLPSGTVGYGYVRGRDTRHAELVALLDALLQDGGDAHGAVGRLERSQIERRHERARKANATKVEFFTLVRGDNEA